MALSIVMLLPLVRFYNNDLTTSIAPRTITYTLSRPAHSTSISYSALLFFPLVINPTQHVINYVTNTPAITIDPGVTVLAVPPQNTILDLYLRLGQVNDLMSFQASGPLAITATQFTYGEVPIENHVLDPSGLHLNIQLLISATNASIAAIFASTTFSNASNNPDLHLEKDIPHIEFRLSFTVASSGRQLYLPGHRQPQSQ